MLLAAASVSFAACNKDSDDEPLSPADTSESPDVNPSAEPSDEPSLYDLTWTERYINDKREAVSITGLWRISKVITYSSEVQDVNIFETIAQFNAVLDIKADGAVDVLLNKGSMNFGTGTWSLAGDALHIVADIMLAGHQDLNVTIVGQYNGTLLIRYAESVESPVVYSDITFEPYTVGAEMSDAELSYQQVGYDVLLRRDWHLDLMRQYSAGSGLNVAIDPKAHWDFTQDDTHAFITPAADPLEHASDAFVATLDAQHLTLVGESDTRLFTVIDLNGEHLVLRGFDGHNITEGKYTDYYFSIVR